ncbi:hypothetical protein [Wolbachia endosymbiont of Brugia malayi]|uniref:hypothetical protein n=1 Tax=Wolbachia endosymbiont of Brugia malayi TaxID=80849 RepID=UPI00059FB177|nr:hypothetical protein [Wolbachia endosymbiont of Brugia malayi]
MEKKDLLPDIRIVIEIIISSGLLVVFQAKINITDPLMVKIIVPNNNALSIVLVFIIFLLNTLPNTYNKAMVI